MEGGLVGTGNEEILLTSIFTCGLKKDNLEEVGGFPPLQ